MRGICPRCKEFRILVKRKNSDERFCSRCVSQLSYQEEKAARKILKGSLPIAQCIKCKRERRIVSKGRCGSCCKKSQPAEQRPKSLFRGLSSKT